MAWAGQLEKIKRDSVLADAISMMLMPSKNPSGSGFINLENVVLPYKPYNKTNYALNLATN